jgi:hypothetical protein
MPATRRDDMHRHASVKQKRFMGAAQIVQSQPGKAELACLPSEFLVVLSNLQSFSALWEI